MKNIREAMLKINECADVDTWKIVNPKYAKEQATTIIGEQLINRGFRIIAVSQTLLQKEVE